MTVILNSGSSVLLVTGTETTLTQIGIPGRYQLIADLVNLAAGDVIEFRSKVMAAPTGTARVLEYMQFQGAQPADDTIKMGTVTPNDQTDAQALIFTAKQTFGVGRTLVWKVLRVDAPDVVTAVQGGFVSVSGTVIAGTVQDKTGYFLGTPQIYDRIGNTTGSTQGNIVFVITGTAAAFDPSIVWSFTGARALNGLQQWNLSGTITNVFNVLNQVLASGVVNPVTASVVQGGQVTVSGTVLASSVQGLVGVSGTVIPISNFGKFTIISATPNSAAFDVGPDTVDNIYNKSLLVLVSGPFAGQTRFIADYYGAQRKAMLAGYWVNIPASGTQAVIVPFYDAGITTHGLVSGTPTATSFTMEPTHASSVDNIYNGQTILIYDQASPNAEARIINGFNGGSKVVTFTPPLNHVPTQGDVYLVFVEGRAQVDVPASGTIVPTSAVLGGVVTVSGTVVASAVQGGQVTVSGTVLASAVQGGVVTVSGTVVADVRSLVGVSGTVLASAVQSLVGVSGTVIASVVQGGFVTVSGVVTAGNVTGSVFGNVNGTVGAVQGGFVIVSGTVVVGQNNDKTGYSLSNPQTFNLIGNISGTITNVFNVVSGTQASIDYSKVWSFTGSKIVDAVAGGFVTASGVVANVDPSVIWNYTGTKVVDAVRGGFVSVSGTVVVSSGTVNTVYNVVSGTSASIDYAAIWNFTGSRSLNVDQHWTLVGNISGTIMPPISAIATGVVIDYSQVWAFPTRTLTVPVFPSPATAQGNNLNLIRGDTFVWSPTNLGSLANLSKLYFTAKRLFTDLDSEAELMVEKTAGLIYINRAPAANPLHGVITILDVVNGNIQIQIDASETAKLDLLADIYYDVQFINTSGIVTTLVNGLITFQGDATRGTS